MQQCPYAACRRDMITRHMRTHARYELQDSHSIDEVISTGGAELTPTYIAARSVSTDSGDGIRPLKDDEAEPLPSPGSPMDTAEENK